MLIPIACCWWSTEWLKFRKYFINGKKILTKRRKSWPLSHFSPDKYLFIMTWVVSIEQCEKVNLLFNILSQILLRGKCTVFCPTLRIVPLSGWTGPGLISGHHCTHETLWIKTFKPFSPEMYLFAMTLTVSIEQREKENLFRPNTPQRHRFMSHSPYCHVVRLNGPSAYICTPL